jgi:hypothetical protein
VLRQLKFAEEEYKALAARVMQQQKFLVELSKLHVAALQRQDTEQDTVLTQLKSQVSSLRERLQDRGSERRGKRGIKKHQS